LEKNRGKRGGEEKREVLNPGRKNPGYCLAEEEQDFRGGEGRPGTPSNERERGEIVHFLRGIEYSGITGERGGRCL